MSSESYYLPLIWMFLVIFVIACYVILDGFDLGIGMLFSCNKKREYRDLMVSTISPVWDGNETWLVLGGATLFGIYPRAYSILLPAFYIPIVLMVASLIFRGVAFEFRSLEKTPNKRHCWDVAFFAGSALASFCQGTILGGVIKGIPLKNGDFCGSMWDWLAPFDVVTGFSVMIGYSLLGASWLFWRTTGYLQEKVKRQVQILSIILIGYMVLMTFWTSLLNVTYIQSWFMFPRNILACAVILLVLLSMRSMWQGLHYKHSARPFLCTIVWFLLGLYGLASSICPYIIPPTLTIWDVSSPVSSQKFQLIGTLMGLPILIAYTIFSYYPFRGKVTQAHDYHD